MTDRDHFAAAALTGLLYQEVDDEFAMSYIVGRAYLWADAMLRERCREGGDCPGQDNAANLDAVPAVRASEATASPERVRVRGDAGTGDTQEIAAYRRFVGEVMNWISEATGFMHDDVLRTDDARDLIHNACMRCWNAFDRIASPTDHGAAPAARASGESVVPQPTPRGDSDRTDKAAPRPSAGTGDTPDSPQPIACSVFDRSQPIAKPTPVHTPPAHATPSVGSVPRDGTEPVAWAVCTPSDGHWSPCYFHEPHAQRCANAIVGEKNVVPLYRHPPCQDASQKNLTLSDAEREAVSRSADTLKWMASGGCLPICGDDAATLRGLLERMGGGR